jgi:hypothetical protein
MKNIKYNIEENITINLKNHLQTNKVYDDYIINIHVTLWNNLYTRILDTVNRNLTKTINEKYKE